MHAKNKPGIFISRVIYNERIMFNELKVIGAQKA